jgi:hypothetical protein
MDILIEAVQEWLSAGDNLENSDLNGRRSHRRYLDAGKSSRGLHVAISAIIMIGAVAFE